jgi:hypothetical protein
VTVGYCDGDELATFTEEDMAEFLGLVNAGQTVNPCTWEIPEGYWLVSFSGAAAERTAVVNSVTTVTDSSGDSNTIIKPSDVTIAMCGPGALQNKRAMLEKQLSAAAPVMSERTLLVHEGMQAKNEEPCRGCPTAYPKACGWKEYAEDGDGDSHESKLYTDFTDSLSELENEIVVEEHSHKSVIDRLKDTVTAYSELEKGGCE